MKELALPFVIAFSLAGLFGCDEAAEEIDQVVDCTQICNKYDECVDDDYDVTSCISDCEDMADMSQAFADQASECETCTDDRSCAESFPCVDECVGVVP